MPDRGKVVKGLEWILNDIEENGHYRVNYYADEIRDALALLKEQDPMEPKLENFYGENVAFCGNCGAYLGRSKFCSKCGRKVKWE